ncbi:MAG: phospholipid carrier-dependent glycosyltransferase [Verrucomicrobiae bacterium]|nr:phospholipid carrier-dependent glycosyltransferase [Verrucomicrobiae bacterium]
MQPLTASDHLSPKKHFSFTQLFLALLALFVYFYGLGSDHLATNGDELLYAQIVRATAQSGHWLPLQSPIAYHRNTKPPLLFWQGIVSTDWGNQWSLFNLRWPNVVYTLLTAFLLFLLGKRLTQRADVGLLAGLIFLSFFGTFRYGRCFLTSAPEVFWLFLPLFILLQWPRSSLSWKTILLSGFIIGIGLLYKSFALIIPIAAGKVWWRLHAHKYDFKKWLRHDAIKLFAIIFVALAVFSLWFFLDPHPQAILHDFIIRENLGKFDTGGENYFWNFFVGSSSVWRNVIAYPLNAGVLAPALLAFFVMTFFRRKELSYEETLLWIWVIVVFVVFSLPNQRDERYLLLGMPALAVLLALHWEKIPRWTLALSLVAVFVITAGLAGLALLLEYHLASPIWHFYHYPITYWFLLGITMGTALYGVMKKSPTRALVCPCILLLYLCYAAFLSPFDGPLGQFDQSARDAIRCKKIWVPVNFNAREESYRFLLPESPALLPYDYKESITIDEMKAKLPRFIVSLPLTDQSGDNLQGAHLLGRRLNLIDRFNAKETQAILMGNIAPYLFHQDLLIER